jgi:outer membrane lipoprotein-sorting protein
MEPKERIERFVTDTNVDIHSARDRKVLRDVLQAHRDFKQKHEREPQPQIWRSIMHTRITKLATAATIILAVGLFITVSNWMTGPAWALGQTIEALKSVKAIHIAGRVHYPDRQIGAEVEIWATASSSDPALSGDFFYREGDDHVCVASERENLTYVSTRHSTPNVTVVYITEGLNRRGPIFPSGDMLEEFKKAAENWQEDYRSDPATGKPCVYVTFAGPAVNTARYWLIQIDLETKLPVRAAVWLNEDRQGPAHFDYTTVQYNPALSEDQFEFSTPAGAQIVDCRVLRKHLAETPGLGVPAEGLSAEDACKKVAQAYWQAVIAKDWTTAQRLRPLASGDELAALYTSNPPMELVSIAGMNHLQDPGTFVEVATVTKLTDGTTRKSLLNVDLSDTTAGRIGVVAGTLGPEFYEGN